jgi:hypothetical protein
MWLTSSSLSAAMWAAAAWAAHQSAQSAGRTGVDHSACDSGAWLSTLSLLSTAGSRVKIQYTPYCCWLVPCLVRASACLAAVVVQRLLRSRYRGWWLLPMLSVSGRPSVMLSISQRPFSSPIRLAVVVIAMLAWFFCESFEFAL